MSVQCTYPHTCRFMNNGHLSGNILQINKVKQDLQMRSNACCRCDSQKTFDNKFNVFLGDLNILLLCPSVRMLTCLYISMSDMVSSLSLYVFRTGTNMSSFGPGAPKNSSNLYWSSIHSKYWLLIKFLKPLLRPLSGWKSIHSAAFFCFVLRCFCST